MFDKGIITLSGLVLLGGMVVEPAAAATFNVTKTLDSNDGVCDADCSLREAVIAANAQAGADTIQVPAGTYLLTLIGANEDLAQTGDLDITDNLTITGAGRTQTIIDGNSQDRVFQNFQNITVEITDLAIKNGVTQGLGAGLNNAGTATVRNVWFDGNVAASYGGAIETRSATANMIIDSSLFTNNCSDSGGALDSVGGLSITNSLFDGNVPVVKAGINCPNGDGAAIHVQSSANATIADSTFVNNIGHVGAITAYWGALTITNTTIANNTGLAGQYSSTGAGAIDNQNSFLGGMLITLKNSTVSGNTGYLTGGIEGVINVVNSIVASNVSAGATDCAGNVTSNGYNIFGDLTGCSLAPQATDVLGNPLLTALATDSATGHSFFPLQASSPAIDSADGTQCPANDQLGSTRPIDGDGNGSAVCDRGAIELQPQTLADVCPVGCAYSTIQSAVDAAATGAIITVGPATYLERVTINKDITLQSAAGAATTIIDGTGLGGSVVTIGGGATLNGFTVTGGQAANGAGIFVNGLAFIHNNTITGNAASGNGGGIFVNSYAEITGNTLQSNSAAVYGGGIVVYGAYTAVNVISNTFRANTANYCGGLALNSYVITTIMDNMFRENTATSGMCSAMNLPAYSSTWIDGNIYFANPGVAVYAGASSTGVINNSLFINNGTAIGFVASSQAKVANSTLSGNTNGMWAGATCQGQCPEAVNNIIWGNGTDVTGSVNVSYSVLGALLPGTGNIVADPLFVDPAAGNYRLQAGSPAIDTGKNRSAFGVTTDIANVARPQDGDGLGAGGTGDGSDFDIGAYEYIAP